MMPPFVAPRELHDLASRYALAVDTLNDEALIALFATHGGVLGYGENPIEFRGEAGLRQMIKQVDTAFQRTMHNVFNQTFAQSDEGQVSGITNCIASHILPGDDWVLMDMALRYHNSYVQEDGRWKYIERMLEVVWVETRPVQKFTAAMMSADLKEFQ